MSGLPDFHALAELVASRDPLAVQGPLWDWAQRFPELTAEVLGAWGPEGETHEVVRFRLAGPPVGHERLKLGLFAGVHGDEPAGCAALVALVATWLESPELAAGFEVSVYPVVNPTGFRRGTRENSAGRDLNREFWRDSELTEVRVIERELRATQFHGLIALHADDTSEGHYGYSHGKVLDDLLLRPALLAAERILPRDRRGTIDGFSAHEGVIADCFRGILSPPPEQTPRPFNVIFETPARAPMAQQVEANLVALQAIIATYRELVSFAPHL